MNTWISNPFVCCIWSVLSAGINATSAAMDRALNWKMQKDQQNWQTSEREAQQAFTTSEREAQQGYQTSERVDQNAWSEHMYKNYQSPQAMAAQYAAAGLNPHLAVDGGSVGSPTSGSGSTSGAPTGASSSTPSTSVPYIDSTSLAGGFADIAKAMSDLANAKKQGLDTRLLEDQYNDILKQTKIKTELDTLNIAMGNASIGEKLSATKRINQLYDMDEVNRDTVRKALEADLSDKQAKAVMANLEKEHWFEAFEAKQNEVKSQTASNYAHAGLANEQSETESKIRDARVAHEWAQTSSARSLANHLDVDAYSISQKLIPEINRITAESDYYDAKSDTERENYLQKKIENFFFKQFGQKEIPKSLVSDIIGSLFNVPHYDLRRNGDKPVYPY